MPRTREMEGFVPTLENVDEFVRKTKTIEKILSFQRTKNSSAHFSRWFFSHLVLTCQFFSWTKIPMEKIHNLKKNTSIDTSSHGFVGNTSEIHSLGAACAALKRGSFRCLSGFQLAWMMKNSQQLSLDESGQMD